MQLPPKEDRIPLTKLPSLLGVSRQVIWQYTTHGKNCKTGYPVKLPYLNLPGGRVTTRAALEKWLEDLQR